MLQAGETNQINYKSNLNDIKKENLKINQIGKKNDDICLIYINLY